MLFDNKSTLNRLTVFSIWQCPAHLHLLYGYYVIFSQICIYIFFINFDVLFWLSEDNDDVQHNTSVGWIVGLFIGALAGVAISFAVFCYLKRKCPSRFIGDLTNFLLFSLVVIVLLDHVCLLLCVKDRFIYLWRRCYVSI